MRKITLLLVALSMIGAGLCLAGELPRADFSDSFDSLNESHWRPVVRLSPKKGEAGVRDGRLVLSTPHKAPTEVQVYGKFYFMGDFDISVAYDLPENGWIGNCRFNAGVILSTAGDGVSYKCYVSSSPGESLFYRSRLDVNGVVKKEGVKDLAAKPRGVFRVTRKKGAVTWYVKDGKKWKTIMAFEGQSVEPLAVRFKLQTGGDTGEWKDACPMSVSFDDFHVAGCEKIVLR